MATNENKLFIPIRSNYSNSFLLFQFVSKNISYN